jgi:hypothetical protein
VKAGNECPDPVNTADFYQIRVYQILKNPHSPKQTPETFSYKRISWDLKSLQGIRSQHVIVWNEQELAALHRQPGASDERFRIDSSGD